MSTPAMEQCMFTDAELRVAQERRLKHQGTAKISLDQISLAPEYDEKNVKRLYELFSRDDCDRLNIRNHVTAIVSEHHLQRACRAAQINSRELMTNQPGSYPHLQFATGQVHCLHGQHRLRAGQQFLPPSDQWWTVDLYLDGTVSAGSHSLDSFLLVHPLQISAPSCGRLLRTSILMNGNLAMAKSTGRYVSTKMRAVPGSWTGGCLGLAQTRESDSNNSRRMAINTSVRLLMLCCPSPASGMG